MDHPVAVAVAVTGHGSHNGAESALDLRTIFWTNLLLLGFNPPDYPNVKLHAQIFAGRGGPSAAKAMEIIVHFLFAALDAQAAQERLAKCWPIIDRNQSRDFRIAVVKWLETLKRDGNLPADVSVRKSYFDECRGERFERALLALSNCVLKQALIRECESAGTAVDVHLLESCDAEALKTHVVRAGKHFLDECKQHSEQEREWVAYKNELLSEHRQIATKMIQVERDRRELDMTLANAFGTPIAPAAALARVKDKTDQIAHEWQNLERWVATNRDNMQMVDDVLAGRTNLYRLEAIPAVAASGGASVAGPIANPSVDPLPPDVADIAQSWAKLYSNVITTIGGLVDTRADTPGVVDNETVSQLLERVQGDDPAPLLASIQDLKRRLGAELAMLSEQNEEILANAAGRRLSTVKEENNRASRTPAPPPPTTRFRPQKATPVSTPVRMAAAGYTATPDAVHAIATAVRSEIATALDSADDYAAENEAAAVREKVDAAIANVAKRKQPPGGVERSSTAGSRLALGEKARQREKVSRPAVSASSSSRNSFAAASTELDKTTTSAVLQSRPPAQHPTSGERKSRKDNPAAYEKLCERIVDFVNDMAESPRPSPPVPKRPAAVLARRQRAGSEDRANASMRGKAPQPRTVVFSDGLLVEEPEGDTREHDDDDKENTGAGDAITAALGTQAFRARAEITRTPERGRPHGGKNTSTSSSRRPVPVPLLAVTSPHVLRLPQPSYGMPCSPSPTKTSLAAAHKPKTPSRLANIVTFDSSSNSLGSTVDAQSGLENGEDKATATATVGDFLEGESSYQLDPDELDEIGRNAVPFFSLAQMDDGVGGEPDAAPAVEAAAVAAAAAAEWEHDVDDDDFIMPATPRRTPRRETCDGLDLLGEWGSPSGSFGIASPSFRKDATPTSRVC
ncbi:HAUS augmin-like complex subunit 6 N-terminus-domain-containing protein [Geranomyces variabilis]|nr:HAUS augmin-like complex subunit 6 N-terminus-domain-containing protein [Geranomyces variabilis]KAJ3132690.1 HAUS augmin-like complex subunit 6 [Geranomyces variabilis]